MPGLKHTGIHGAWLVSLIAIILPFLPHAVHAGEPAGIWRLEQTIPPLREELSSYTSGPFSVAPDGDVISVGEEGFTRFSPSGHVIGAWSLAEIIGSTSERTIYDMAIATDGAIYIAGGFVEPIYRIRADGTFDTNFGGEVSDLAVLSDARYLAVSDEGFLFVWDDDARKIFVFDSEGHFVRSWARSVEDGEQSYPGLDLETSSDGRLYIRREGTGIIECYNASGGLLATWDVRTGSSDNFGGYVFDMAVGPDGYVYVSDGRKNYLEKFTSNGSSFENIAIQQSEEQYQGFAFLHVDQAGLLRIMSSGFHGDNNELRIVTGNGRTLHIWGSKPGGRFRLESPSHLAADSKNNIYVIDAEGGIEKFDAAGRWVTAWNPEDTLTGYDVSPIDITVDTNDQVYVLVPDGVLKFRTDGEYLGPLLLEEHPPFIRPCGITSDAAGNIYVGAERDLKVVVLSPDGDVAGEFFAPGTHPSWGAYAVALAYHPAGMLLMPGRYTYGVDASSFLVEFFYAFSTGGQLIDPWPPAALSDFHSDLAINDAGQLFFSDEGIREFTVEGVEVARSYSIGEGYGPNRGHGYVAVDHDDHAYIVDRPTATIHKYRSDYSGAVRRALVVVGQPEARPKHMNDAVRLGGNLAMRALRYQGYQDFEITYLSPDSPVEYGYPLGIDGRPTLANIENSLLGWAKDADSLLVYVVGDGRDGSVRLNDTESLDGATLAQWLGAIGGTVSSPPVVVVDSCEAAQFLEPLAGLDGVRIAGAGAHESAAYIQSGEFSFSGFFWSRVTQGYSMADAVSLAGESTTALSGVQTPVIESTAADAETTFVGNGAAINRVEPTIAGTSGSQTLSNGSTATLYADLVSEKPVSRVIAVITPPGYNPSSDVPITSLARIELLPIESKGDGERWSASYDGFTIEGDYRVAIYARNRFGNVGRPAVDVVTQTQGHASPYGSDANQDGAVDALDVQIVVNAALGIAIEDGYRSDINGNTGTDAADVQLVVNAALGT